MLAYSHLPGTDRPVTVKLLAAPGYGPDAVSVPGVPAWSALVLDGVAVPYDEVVSVRMVESALGLIVEQASHGLDDMPVQHLRMYSRAEFNLWREALQPKVVNPNSSLAIKNCGPSTSGPSTSDASTIGHGSKASQINAARRWLAIAEASKASKSLFDVE